MITLTITSVRSNLFQIVKKVIKGRVPTRVSSKDGNVIIISEEDYESLLETAELLATPGLVKSIKKADKEILKGDVFTFNEVFKQ
jgi:PHD/YefM family antitoxin component YafN of YafNO toxin-antitoxin module